jgi:hypothetical protein
LQLDNRNATNFWPIYLCDRRRVIERPFLYSEREVEREIRGELRVCVIGKEYLAHLKS